MSELHQQDINWDVAMKRLPAMFCGRLDMSTWNAETGVPQKMVYFDGEDDRVVCEGRRADFVAYAANRFQPMQSEIERLAQENAKLREELADEKQRFSDLIMAASNGHPNPCTLGSLCPYCEIERLRAKLTALKATAPYRVEQQQQATVEQGEWVVDKLECPE